MAKARTLVGLDVHAAKVVAAILDAETGELRFQRLGGESEPVVRLVSSLEGPVRASYEAGPTGYGLARALEAAGVECLVAAPGKIPRGATERVKTDRRDAEHLVRLLFAGQLHPVRVPGPAEEALRDLVRAREDLRGDLMRTRHRLSKLLLRHTSAGSSAATRQPSGLPWTCSGIMAVIRGGAGSEPWTEPPAADDVLVCLALRCHGLHGRGAAFRLRGGAMKAGQRGCGWPGRRARRQRRRPRPQERMPFRGKGTPAGDASRVRHEGTPEPGGCNQRNPRS
jgi:hypothetical protein